MTVEPTRICFGIYAVGRTSVICAGLIDTVMLPWTICSFRPVDWFVMAVISGEALEPPVKTPRLQPALLLGTRLLPAHCQC